MRRVIPGNRIYTVFRAYADTNKKFQVVAANSADARKLAMKVVRRINEVDLSHCGIAVKWDIYDGNHGITTLPLGTVILPKLY